MNQGVHYVDMVQWVMGGVKSVQADVRTTTHNIEVEDVANALIEYKNGATGVIQGSTSFFPGMAERVEVHGEYGSAVVEGDQIKVWEVDPNAPTDKSPYGRGVMKQPTPSIPIVGSTGAAPTGAADPTAIWGEQHRLQLEDFVQAIVDNRDPFLTGEMAIEPLKVIVSVYESSSQGGKRVVL
jgi:UDP-N-acetyl-2-amino-2-deoxyglucuronate dehydrogenase